MKPSQITPLLNKPLNHYRLLTPEKKGHSRRENLVDVANDLKRISIDFNRPFLHTVQFNRTAVRGGKKKESEEEEESKQQTPTQQPAAPEYPVVEDVRYDAPERPARLRRQRVDYDGVSHLGLHKIAETDAIAANASIVAAIARTKGPHYENRRYYTILKGREGERGLWMIHYDFRTMNFDEVDEAEEERVTAELTEFMV